MLDIATEISLYGTLVVDTPKPSQHVLSRAQENI